MKYLTVILVTMSAVLIAGVFLWGSTPAVADAHPPLLPAHKKRIMTNCTSATASLRQLHRNDASLRVNRGQVYEYIGTKLMARFNGRLVSNHLDGGKLVETAARYDKALTKFRTSYRIYEQELTAILRLDCQKEPEEFYYGVIDVRRKRADVYQQITRLNQYSNEYYEGFTKFSDAHMIDMSEAHDD